MLEPAYWPLVRLLAEALMQRKVVTGRRNRPVPFRAYRRQLRRWRILAEEDRRNQRVSAAELRRTFGRVA